MDAFWSAPPISRTLTALTFVQSALVYGGLLSAYRVVFRSDLVFKLLPEIWRVITPFLLTGPKLSFLLDLYFMYTYSSSLETGSPRFGFPGDFLTYVIFVSSVIVLTAGFFLGEWIFTTALIVAFIYTWAQDNRGKKVGFIVVTIPSEWLPWATLALTLVLAGWPAMLRDSTGIVAAHLYEFLTRIYPTFGGGRNYITTPSFIRRLFAGQRTQTRTYGTAYRPDGQAPQGSASTGRSSSFGNPWGSRGVGRRLGGD
ncbi:hypothetical protein Egran_00098 [Elaphomyces granulatus]|uniref:Derlin n=1 Tax=Elaphomyces granulatus TaxID=519963 RepID=A0A232M6X2_9EURO|nr:hypothetical protein Egran_00098 [Elaphomyces granulatus]